MPDCVERELKEKRERKVIIAEETGLVQPDNTVF